MKITCILTSFNRPNWIRHALASVAEQTHRNYELIVIDESETFDVRPVVAEFQLPSVRVVHHDVTAEERAKINRLSVNVNEGLAMATGDLICYLADDDFYYVEWFAEAVKFFQAHRDVHAGYGKLLFSHSRERVYPQRWDGIFPNCIIEDPYCRLDHNQIIHRPLRPAILWPTDPSTLTAPDGLFMRAVGRRHPFHPIPASAAVKRMSHGKNLQHSADEYRAGHMEGTRE